MSNVEGFITHCNTDTAHVDRNVEVISKHLSTVPYREHAIEGVVIGLTLRGSGFEQSLPAASVVVRSSVTLPNNTGAIVTQYPLASVAGVNLYTGMVLISSFARPVINHQLQQTQIPRS